MYVSTVYGVQIVNLIQFCRWLWLMPKEMLHVSRKIIVQEPFQILGRRCSNGSPFRIFCLLATRLGIKCQPRVLKMSVP